MMKQVDESQINRSLFKLSYNTLYERKSHSHTKQERNDQKKNFIEGEKFYAKEMGKYKTLLIKKYEKIEEKLLEYEINCQISQKRRVYEGKQKL